MRKCQYKGLGLAPSASGKDSVSYLTEVSLLRVGTSDASHWLRWGCGSHCCQLPWRQSINQSCPSNGDENMLDTETWVRVLHSTLCDTQGSRRLQADSKGRGPQTCQVCKVSYMYQPILILVFLIVNCNWVWYFLVSSVGPSWESLKLPKV